jgi:sulfonate dioxygenase
MSTTQTITAPESNEPVLKLSSGNNYAFSHLLPTFSQEDHYPPLEPYEHKDPGHRALLHEVPLGYLKSAHSISEITPGLGTEVRGIKLDQLDSRARDELALHVAQRGLVVFRDQDGFINGPPERYLEWGRHFGR